MIFLTLWLFGLMVFYANPMNRINDPSCVYNPSHPINCKMRAEQRIRKEIVAQWKGIPRLELERMVRHACGQKTIEEMSIGELNQLSSCDMRQRNTEQAYGSFWVGGGVRLWHINAVQKTLFVTLFCMIVRWLFLKLL